MIPFFSRTGTKRNLDGARDAGWGILLSASGAWRDEGFQMIGADNGEWTERKNPLPFATREDRYRRFLDYLGERPRFIALPDIVTNDECAGLPLESLDLSLDWLDRLRGHPCVLLIIVQDGQTPRMLAPFLGPKVGIFIGGSTDWKESTLPAWGRLSAETGCYLHVGRVNSARRIWLCGAVGSDAIGAVDSFDGTSVTKFAETLHLLDSARKQIDLEHHCRDVSNLRPHAFARRCREIRETMHGHQAHRALDLLSNEVLRSLGYGGGVDIFEEGVREWHRDALPYPL